MKYKKIDLQKYNLHIIKTDKFKTVTIKINFKRKIKKEDITIRRLLMQVLLQSSLKYPTKRSLASEVEDLYAVTINADNLISGNYDLMTFAMSFLNEKYTEVGMNNRTIDFLLQIIMNPNIKNKAFDKKSFDLGKNLVKDDINSFSDYPDRYSVSRMFENMTKKGPYSYRNCGYIKDLNKITTSSLASYYYDFINNDIIDIIVVGNVDEDSIKSKFESYLTRQSNNPLSDSHFIINNNIRKKELIIKEKIKINQSKLVMGCNFDKLTEFELRYVLNVYSFIIGGSGDSLLFKTVREKNSLCYSISSSYQILNGVLIIRAGIDSDKYDKTVELIRQAIEQMKNGEFDEEEIDKAKMIFKNSCISITDSANSIANTYLSHEYLNSDLIEEKIKKINQVTKDMVVLLANKIHIDTIYMLEGEIND